MRPLRLAAFSTIAIVCALAWQGYGSRPTMATAVESPRPRLESRAIEQVMVVAKHPAAATPERDPNLVEVCGVGLIDKTAGGNDAERKLEEVLQRAVEDQARQGRGALINRLLAEPDGFSQAVGFFVQTWGELEDRRQSEARKGAEPCIGDDCPNAVATKEAMPRLADRLAHLAMSTSDPRLYSLAFKTCQGPSPSAACASLSTQQWARIEPDNAAPWLYVLDEAATRKDAAAIDDALFHMANAKKQDDRYFSVAGEISRHAGTDDSSAFAAYLASIGVIGVAAAHPWPLTTLAQACRGKAVEDANRRQVCEDIAETLANRSDTLLMASIGVGMGRRLGWPVERSDAIHGLQGAAMESMSFNQVSEGLALSCDGMRTQLRRFARLGEIGEIGIGREWMAATGRSQESYTKKARDDRLRAAAAETVRQDAEAASAVKGMELPPR